MERGHAFVVLLVDVHAGRLDQNLAGFDAAEMRRQVKWSPAFAILKVRFGSGFQEQLDQLVVAVLGSHVKGTLTSGVDGIDNGATLKEELGPRQMA